MKKNKEVDPNTKYDLPITNTVEFDEKYIIISQETSQWLIFDKETQCDIFYMLQKGSSIQEVLECFEGFATDVIFVLTQIEAKEFYDKRKQSIFSDDIIHIYLTNACNLSCPHCYMYSGGKYKDELSTDEIKKLGIDFYKLGGKKVTLSGGEAVTRTDFEEIVRYFSEIGLKIGIMSNGTLWTSKLIKQIAKYNISKVQISLDGFDDASNSIVRGKESFYKAVNTIKNLIDCGVRVNVGMTPPYELLQIHKKQYLEFARNLIKYGKGLLSIQFSYEIIEGRCISKEEIARFKGDYYKLVDEIMEELYPENTEKGFIENLKNNRIFDNCGYGGINIAANGDVYFCSRITEVQKYSNIRDCSLEEIINISRKIQEKSHIDNLYPCCECDLKYICGGGCRIDHFKELTRVNIDYDEKIQRDKCSLDNKEHFYELMIKTNERFYR